MDRPRREVRVLEEAQRYGYDLDQLARAIERHADDPRHSTPEPIPRVPIEGDSGHIGHANEALTRAGILFQSRGELDRRDRS